MLNTLDIVIGFAVIMSVLSVLITIIVQMVSTGLALRGKNLANALALTFQTIDPKIGEQAHSLAAQILRDPIFSDSIWRTKSRVVDGAGLALLDAEKKLAWAKHALQANADPAKQSELTARVGELTLAFNAARVNLGKLAELMKEERELKQATNAVARAADENTRAEALQAVQAAKAKVAAARAAAKLPEVKRNREKPWGFWTWPSDGARQLGTAIRPGEIYRVVHELAEHTETEAILKGIPAGLASAASAIIVALTKEDRPTTEARQKLRCLNWVGDTYFKAMPAQQLALVNSLPDFAATVERATTQAYDRFQRWFGSGQDRAEQWFQTHMRGVTIVMANLAAFLLQLDTMDIYRQLRDQPALTAALVKAAPEVLEKSAPVLDPAKTADETSRRTTFRDLQKQVDTAGFTLAPAPLLGRWDSEPLPAWAGGIYPFAAHYLVHLIGILMTAGLLTLGAPFWFNMLKNLMSLRPAVAALIEKRPTSAPALPQAPATPGTS